MSLLAVVISLLGLMYLAYRGINVLILAPLMALFAVLCDPQAPVLATYTQIFMPALGQYLLKYFPIFMLGSIFGKLMGDSGSAATIGEFVAKKLGEKRAITAVVLACALLTYGGVSLFVVAFCVFPIAVSLFKSADIPKRLIPGSIALGAFTFTMTALPGTPAIQNVIPMPYFGTTTFAAPGLGTIGALIMFGFGWIWLERRAQKAQKKGEGYLASADPADDDEKVQARASKHPHPHIVMALLPLLIVVGLNYILSEYIFPKIQADYLQTQKFGNVTLASLQGLWALIVALSVAIVFIIAVNWKRLSDPVKSLNAGTMGSLLPIFNTASEVGYGATIASLSSFVLIKDSILGIAPHYPLISEAISINALAGITGSASGGLSIALEALSKNYMELAQTFHISPELLHRVASMSCGGFDTLPHNGAVITLLTICGLTHKKSYLDIMMVAVVGPVVATTVVVVIGSMVGSF